MQLPFVKNKWWEAYTSSTTTTGYCYKLAIRGPSNFMHKQLVFLSFLRYSCLLPQDRNHSHQHSTTAVHSHPQVAFLSQSDVIKKFTNLLKPTVDCWLVGVDSSSRGQMLRFSFTELWPSSHESWPPIWLWFPMLETSSIYCFELGSHTQHHWRCLLLSRTPALEGLDRI